MATKKRSYRFHLYWASHNSYWVHYCGDIDDITDCVLCDIRADVYFQFCEGALSRFTLRKPFETKSNVNMSFAQQSLILMLPIKICI